MQPVSWHQTGGYSSILLSCSLSHDIRLVGTVLPSCHAACLTTSDWWVRFYPPVMQPVSRHQTGGYSSTLLSCSLSHDIRLVGTVLPSCHAACLTTSDWWVRFYPYVMQPVSRHQTGRYSSTLMSCSLSHHRERTRWESYTATPEAIFPYFRTSHRRTSRVTWVRSAWRKEWTSSV